MSTCQTPEQRLFDLRAEWQAKSASLRARRDSLEVMLGGVPLSEATDPDRLRDAILALRASLNEAALTCREEEFNLALKLESRLRDTFTDYGPADQLAAEALATVGITRES